MEKMNGTPKLNYTPISPSIVNTQPKLVILGDLQTTNSLCTVNSHDYQ